MRNKRFVLEITLILVLIFVVIGCDNPANNDPTYTIWTDMATYSEFQSIFQTNLYDGYYVHLEFTSSQWNSLSPSLTNEGKHEWTEDQIYDWFIGRGFDSSTANQERAWLLTIDHGFIASRSGSIVYMLLK